eukprot:Rhum_TRINITY_DN2232_c0_g2::Rhum_TRINITY_DN2232_c0_g2_i1::g.6476::m.6476
MYDIVVVGATGYSGRLISRYLASAASASGLRWAVCGRNGAKLEALSSELGGCADVLVADSSDAAAVDSVVRRATVVVAAAGPFSVCGTPVFRSCVENATHYVDINGETPWVREMLDAYGSHPNLAEATLIPNCGFDAVPSDLGAFAAARALGAGNPAGSVRGYFEMVGTLSGGTVATGMHLEQGGFGVLRKMADPYLLGGRPSTGRRREDGDVRETRYSEEAAAWTGPFLMAPINTRVVRRSLELLSGTVYAPDAGYTECAVARDEASAQRLLRKPSLEERRALVEAGKLPAPGGGATDAQNARFRFRAQFFCDAAEEGGGRARAVLAGGGPYTE